MTVLLYRLRGAVTSTLFILTASAVLASAQGCPNFGFRPSAPFDTGTYPASVVTSDFNNDGNPDLATANYISENIAVHLGVGDGTFGAASFFPNPGNPFSIAAGDINNDGNADLAAANSATNNVSVRLGNGSGGFGSAINFEAGGTPFAVYILDLNSDGNRDLVSANYGSNTVSVLLGNGTGGFAAAIDSPAGQTPISLVFSDFDSNGTIDIAAANNVAHTFSILPGNGNGTYGTPVAYGVGQFPQSIVAGDFNADGLSDIVTANSNSANVTIRLGLSGGGFGAATNFGVGNTPFGMATADLNFDGNADVVTTNFFSNSVSVLLGSGNGRFEPTLDFPAGSEPASVAVGDMNGDGSVDLATSNTGTNNLSILLNNCAANTNTPPTITPSNVSRKKGAGVSNSVVATVADAEDPEADLSVTINGNGTATTNGVTISNLTIDAQGSVHADVSAACNATDATFTLRVTDLGGLFAEATLVVTATASDAPTLDVKTSISIFPHNGKMRDVTMDQMLASVSDDCDADLSSTVVIDQVTSDEFPSKGKDKDIVIAPDCKTVSLRANRDNQGDGRVYSVRLRVRDSDGNTATAEFKVAVPVNPSSGPAVEGPPVITISGDCP
ncbi:MAG TPA: VCBS repeat-containing protein [Pyrinomonadaceae bacterium]|nr:VCBS repeat-containing protein [Pyrinomonadaceae bacterium]